ncbi:MAG: nuclear transport factor 2 family protein [Endozoicomonas sp.]
MISTKIIKGTLEKYIQLVDASDIDGIIALYADNATVEDPVGTEPYVGIEAIDAFYRNGLGQMKVNAELTGQVRTTTANEGAMPFVVRAVTEEGTMIINVIDVMKFNDEGKIISMKAYWSYEDNVETGA